MNPDGTTQGGLVTRLSKWAAHPFSTNLDLLGVVLTVGLVIVVAFFWNLILGDIVGEG